MPQLTGDRPGTGWEAIAFLHNRETTKRWNGGSRDSVFECLTVRAGRFFANYHTAEKPVKLVGELIDLFTDPGDLILDPFAGSGTTLRAAKDLSRRCIGIEIEERYCEITVKRLQQENLPLELPATHTPEAQGKRNDDRLSFDFTGEMYDAVLSSHVSS